MTSTKRDHCLWPVGPIPPLPCIGRQAGRTSLVARGLEALTQTCRCHEGLETVLRQQPAPGNGTAGHPPVSSALGQPVLLPPLHTALDVFYFNESNYYQDNQRGRRCFVQTSHKNQPCTTSYHYSNAFIKMTLSLSFFFLHTFFYPLFGALVKNAKHKQGSSSDYLFRQKQLSVLMWVLKTHSSKKLILLFKKT